jgi:Spy/CpxP family protein refolding chaperone
MEALFQQNRLHLIDLTAALEQENAILDPLLQAERPDEHRILAQIDRIAQARAELEKANARFLLGIRAILTPDQWRKLDSERPEPPARDRHDFPPPRP